MTYYVMYNVCGDKRDSFGDLRIYIRRSQRSLLLASILASLLTMPRIQRSIGPVFQL